VKKTVKLMPYMINQNWVTKLLKVSIIYWPKWMVEPINQNALCYRGTQGVIHWIWGGLYSFFDDLRRMRNKINRRINFLTIRKMKFCMVD
jgi:hypothetical protein